MAGIGNLFAGMGPGAAGAPARQQVRSAFRSVTPCVHPTLCRDAQTVLTEFRAGRMRTEKIHGGPRLRIEADPRKGKVMLVRVRTVCNATPPCYHARLSHPLTT